MADRDSYKAQVKRLILTEKARAGLTYKELAERLKAVGIRQSDTNLSTKISRGGLGAEYFLALLHVMGVKNLDVPSAKAISHDEPQS